MTLGKGYLGFAEALELLPRHSRWWTVATLKSEQTRAAGTRGARFTAKN